MDQDVDDMKEAKNKKGYSKTIMGHASFDAERMFRKNFCTS